MPRAQSAQSWEKPVAEGIKSIRCKDLDGAFKSLDEAIRLANDGSYVVYDTRASFYEKQNCFNHALCDARKTIDIAPEKWHGYLRSARLLASLGQSDAALDMCSQALARLDDGLTDDPRRRELTALRQHLETPRRKCSVSESGIPIELFLAIFKLSGSPSVITHVCRRWRAVAHSRPILWRSLVLMAPAEGAVQKINEWHQWSYGRIELTLRESLATALFPTENSKMHLEDNALYVDILAAFRRLDFTGLQKFHVERIPAGPFTDALSEGTGFVNLPRENLRVFSVTTGWCIWGRAAMVMHRLTSLEYKIHSDGAYVRGFYLLVQANPGLERLVIEMVINFSECPTPEEPLTLAYLRHLEMRGGLPFWIKGGNFSLPALQVLRVTWLKDAALQLTGLLEDAGTSFAELTELTTSRRLLGPEILTAILLRAPKLQTLNCTDMDVVVAESLSKPCTALLPSSSSCSSVLVPTELPILCPALSAVNFSWSPKLTTDLVVQIVKARIALSTASQDYQLPATTTAAGDDDDDDDGCDRRRVVISCIRRLKVDRCRLIDPEMLPWFEEHVPDRFTCSFDKKRMQPRRGRTRTAKGIMPSHYF